MATIEWALPTAFIVYLLKPCFKAFLKAARKDHYEILKGKLASYIADKKKIKQERLQLHNQFIKSINPTTIHVLFRFRKL